MDSVGMVGNYGYVPQIKTFTAQTRAIQTPVFAGETIDPQAQEKTAKRKKNLINLVGAAVVAAGTFLFLKKTKMGQNLLTKLKDLFKGKKANVAGGKTTSSVVKEGIKQNKPKSKIKIVSEHADLRPNQKVKMKNGGGKEEIHKVRRNKKQIIEQTRLREQMEAFTEKDLEAYSKSLGAPATAEEHAFIAANNKEATTSLADVMESKGIKRGKNKSRRVVLQQEPKVTPQTVKPAAAPVTDTSAKIADLQAQIAKQEEQIAKYSKPGMERWAKPAQARKTKLEAELNQLLHPNSKPPVAPTISPEVKKEQIEAAWAQQGKVNPPKAPKIDIPTRNDVFARSEAEAAKMAKEMAKEEAETLARMFPEE